MITRKQILKDGAKIGHNLNIIQVRPLTKFKCINCDCEIYITKNIATYWFNKTFEDLNDDTIDELGKIINSLFWSSCDEIKNYIAMIKVFN